MNLARGEKAGDDFRPVAAVDSEIGLISGQDLMSRIKLREADNRSVGNVHSWRVGTSQRVEGLRFLVKIQDRLQVSVFDHAQNDFVVLEQPAGLLQISGAGQHWEGGFLPLFTGPPLAPG